jgi:CheY-like chemotaxis protein
VDSRTVLIVDDESDIRESLRDALGDEGYLVAVAANGREALDLLPHLQRPCAIILDMLMPVMNGNEFYAALQAAPDLSDIPVLVSTSDPARAPSELPVVVKPVNLERLLTVVAGLF